MISANKLNRLLEEIARLHLRIDTLDARGRDRDDFHEVSVWDVQVALRDAYLHGVEAGRVEMCQEVCDARK